MVKDKEISMDNINEKAKTLDKGIESLLIKTLEPLRKQLAESIKDDLHRANVLIEVLIGLTDIIKSKIGVATDIRDLSEEINYKKEEENTE